LEELAWILRRAQSIEAQPFRSEGKAALPGSGKRVICREINFEKVKHFAEHRA